MTQQAMPDLPVEGVVAGWIGLLRRRWLVGSAVFLLVFGFAALQILSARNVYRADAKLRIGEPPPTTGLGAGSVLGFMRLGGDPFANDLELLNSRTVAAAVVRDVGLNVSVAAPRGWYRDSLFESISASDSTPKALYDVRWVTDTRIEVKQQTPVEKQIGTFAAGAPAQFGGIRVVFRARRPSGPDEIALSTRPFGEVVRKTESRIKVARRRRDANVAEIVATDTDPAIAQRIVSSTLQRFTELRARIADREVVQNVDSLRRVAQATLVELKSAETDLERMQRESMLVDPTAQTAAFVGRYSATTTQLETTRAELQAITSALQRASTVETAAERWTRLLAYRPFLSNGTIGELLSQLNELEAKRAMLAPRRTENNREYSLVLDQIAYLDRSLTSLARDIQLSLQDTERRLQAQVASMESALAAVPRGTIELARRQRSARMLSEVLILTEQRLRQEELKQALSFSNVQVIDPTALRFKPIWPRKKLGLAVGWVVAAFCGVLAMAVVEQADRRVRRASDLMRLAGIPVLGVAVRSPAGLRFTAHELRAVVHHASANGRGPLRIVLAPVGATDAAELAEQMRAAFPVAVAPGYGDVKTPEVVQATRITDFASASAAAGPDVPVALVIDADRTTRAEVARAASLIRQAGGRLGGAIVICKNDRAAANVWA